MADKKSAATERPAGAAARGAPAYGGFWIRVLAYLADTSIITFVLMAAAVPAVLLGEPGVMAYAAVVALGPFLYFVLMQASSRQATYGKGLLGLKVVRAGTRAGISFLRSLGRELAKILSAAVFGLGFIIAGFTQRKQGLHDLIASTTVVREESARVLAAIVVTVAGIAIPVFAMPLIFATFLGGTVPDLLGPLMAGQVPAGFGQSGATNAGPAPKASTAPAAQRAEAKVAPAVADNALAIARAEAQLARQLEEYDKLPRKTFVGARPSEARYARYLKDWRQKIERIANLDNRENPRGGTSGSLRLTVSINADGTLAGTDLELPSGDRVLDAAAERIVRRAAPYAKFPPDIRKDTDILVITRTWHFAAGKKVFGD